MRPGTLLAFVLGFALGMATLAGFLWRGGRFDRATVAARSADAADLVRDNPPPRVKQPVPAPVPLGGSTPLAMPIAGIDPATLTSTFNDNRSGRPHEALDIVAPRGTPVKAVDEGNVVKLFNSKDGGLTVYQFNDARDLCYYYAHLDRYAPGLKEGTLLRRGDVLGYVGSTGNASPEAPHLHFAVFRLGPEREWWKGTAIDPLPMLRAGPQ